MGYFKQIPELIQLRAVQEEMENLGLEGKRSDEEIARLAEEQSRRLKTIVEEFVAKCAAVRPELFIKQAVVGASKETSPGLAVPIEMVRLVAMSSNGPLRGFFADKRANLYRSGFETADPKPVYVVKPVAYEEWASIWFDVDPSEIAEEMQEVLETGEY